MASIQENVWKFCYYAASLIGNEFIFKENGRARCKIDLSGWKVTTYQKALDGYFGRYLNTPEESHWPTFHSQKAFLFNCAQAYRSSLFSFRDGFYSLRFS
jgi:hypothetical protein